MNEWNPATSLPEAEQRFAAGEPSAALEILLRCPEAERDQAWQQLRGLVHATSGELPQAISLYEQLLGADPHNIDLRTNLGCMQLNAGDAETAQATLAIACAMAPNHPAAWHNLGLAQMQLRRWRDAAGSLQQSSELAPQVAEAKILLAQALARAGDDQGARQALLSLGQAPQLGIGDWLQVGLCFMALREPAAALHAFAQVLEQQPGHTEALLNSAVLKEQANRPADAQRLLDALVASQDQHPLAALTRARLLRREGRHEEALNCLPGENIPDPDLAVEIAFERARALDALGRHAEALEWANRANTGARQLRAGPDDVLDQLLAQGLSEPDLAQWTEADSQDPAPIFLLGLPRSGTTLLDILLDGHPELQLLSEKPCLEELVAQVQAQTGQPYPAALAALNADQISSLRLLYFDSANRHLNGRQPGTTLVDKNPLNLLRLPLIQRLFPRAKVVFSERDLRDAALSCFFNDLGGFGRQGFWSITESLQLLQKLREFFLAQAEGLGTDWHGLHYEALVSEPEACLRSLCEFLQIEYQASMLETAQTASARGAIGTPSYHAVTQPISSSPVGRWRHYAAEFGD